MADRLHIYVVTYIILIGIFILGGGENVHASSPAATCGYPVGPKSGTMTVDTNEYKACNTLQGLSPPGLHWYTVSGMPSDSPINNGINPGYCVDLTGTVMDNPMFGNIVYSITFWSSQDQSLPTSLRSVQSKDGKTYVIPWDKVNYVLNTYPSENWINLQAALWDLVHGCVQQPGSLYTCDILRPAPYYFPYGPSAPYGCPSSNPPAVDIAKVQIMVADASLHGNGFVSKAGEKLAAVGQITNCSPSTVCNQHLPYQVIFVPSSCPTCTGSVGDYIWKDLNGNGIQDAGEPGLPGVTVHLTGTDDRGQAIDLTTTTDSSGKYQFSQLCTGDYSIKVESSSLPAGVKPTASGSSNGDDNQPFDSNEPEGTTVKITTDSSSNLTVDFGYVPECGGSIGDYVWKDLDNNGLQNAGEPAFPGIVVNLTGTTIYGNPITLSATTNINGMYSFTGLCQGDYRVTVDETTVPVSFVSTLSTSANGDDGVANDSNVSTGTSVYLPNDMSLNANVDFGYIPKCSGSIGDYVWKDLNENGQQDINEPGVPGVEVSLSGTNSYGQLISMKASTDADGKYSFPGICDGTYTVTVNPSTAPLGFIPTEPLSNTGSDLATNDSNDPAGTKVVLTGDSAVNSTVDFGYVPFCSGTIGDTVWNDLNGNGLQDDGYFSGINGIEVLLTGTSDYGQPVNLSKTTMSGGLYQFANLCKGTYTVAVNAGDPDLPQGAVPTSPLSANGNDMVPQDSNNQIGTTVVFSNDSSSNPTVDFGYVIPALIGDRVWVDVNKNGTQDVVETGLANVTATLFSCTSQNQLKVATTDATGFYSFSVDPGSYYVVFGVPDHFFFTTKNAVGSTVANDSNASMSGITDCLTVESGEKNLTVDAGLYTAPVSATCVSITAVQGVAITPVSMTANGGTGTPYIFSATGLPAGITMDTDGTISGIPTVSGTFNYTVTITDKDDNVGSIDCSVTVNPPVTANCVMITAVKGIAITPVTMIASGGVGGYIFTATGLPAGLTMSSTGTISGTPTFSGNFNYTVIINDEDGNVGTFNCSVMVNPPVSATCVMITAVQGVAITPVTMNATGGAGASYAFTVTGLPAGLTMASNGTISGTPTVSGTFSYTVTITDKDGNVGTSNCSVVVNPPVSATCVSITAVQGTAITSVAMTASGGTGTPYSYSATGLPAGITMSSTGIISGTPTVSGTFSYTVTAKDKDGHAGTSSCSVSINPPPVCIPCKEGVKQMTLVLNWRTSSGDPKERIRVHADGITGAILFDTWSDSNPSTGLPVGSSFTFNVPLTAKSVIVTVQGANNRKETIKATFSAECDLIVGQTSDDTYITFKVTDVVLDGDTACGGGYAGIGDYVWIDTNKDGIQDINEAGSAGVTVKLFSCGGTTPLATATTDAGGKYLFANLEPGDYSLQFVLPSGYFFTPKDEGLLDTIDSDADTTTGSTVCTTLLAGENDLTWDAGIKKISISTGCTYTIGYWKNHTGVGPQADVVTPLLPQYLGTQGGAKTISITTAKMAGDILSQAVYGTSSNGITKLYAQLLAAKLNLKTGADSSAVDSIIAAADKFLATRNYNDWSSLSSSNLALVDSWHDSLDDYNNGLTGPGHCGSLEVVPCVSIDKNISIDGGKSWLDADTQAAAAARSVTTTVYYKLIVQNCGQVDLANVSVNDPALGVSNYLISSLSAGISKTLTYSQIPKLKVYNQCMVTGAFENVATAVADYKGLVVTASDSAWLVCNVTSTCIDIIKDISVDGGSTWKTADNQTTAPTVAAPYNAYYRLTVKNCGSNSLSNVVVKDDELGISSYTIGSLSAGASKVLTSKQVSKLYDPAACTTSGMFLNTAIVSGMYGTKTVTDSDIAWLVCTGTTTGGCTYTQGYWKTHTIYDGDKKRNSTWDKVGGENQLFFKTGQTWYEALMSEPATGNAYYILAHQYIAATLNKLSGADAEMVDADLKHAAQLLDKYDGFPLKMEDISGSLREDFISTAYRLDQYNNGITGPGHCK